MGCILTPLRGLPIFAGDSPATVTTVTLFSPKFRGVLRPPVVGLLRAVSCLNFVNTPLRSGAFIWYKQFTESSVWLAGRIV